MKNIVAFFNHFWDCLEDYSKYGISFIGLLVIAIPVCVVRMDERKWYHVYGESVLYVICAGIVIVIALALLLAFVRFIEDIVLSAGYAIGAIQKKPHVRDMQLKEAVYLISSVNRDTNILDYITNYWDVLKEAEFHVTHLACNKRITSHITKSDWSIIVLDKATGKSYYYGHRGVHGAY